MPGTSMSICMRMRQTIIFNLLGSRTRVQHGPVLAKKVISGRGWLSRLADVALHSSSQSMHQVLIPAFLSQGMSQVLAAQEGYTTTGEQSTPGCKARWAGSGQGCPSEREPSWQCSWPAWF